MSNNTQPTEKLRPLPRLTLVAAVIVLGILMYSAIPSDPGDKLIEHIEAALQGEVQEIDLQKVLGFEWEKMCLFYPANSEPYSAYLAYEEYVQKHKLSLPLLDRKKYNFIFLFREKNRNRQFASYTKEALLVNSKKNWLRIRQKGSTALGGCLQGAVVIKKEAPDYLILSQRVVKNDN